MSISQIASCSSQICQQLGDFCSTVGFQSFVAEIEIELEHQIIEHSAIAASRASSENTGALCDLSLMQLTQAGPHFIHSI